MLFSNSRRLIFKENLYSVLSLRQIISIYYFIDIVIWNLKLFAFSFFRKTYAGMKQSGMRLSKCMKNTN